MPGTVKATPVLTRLIMVPLPPKFCTKDWIGRKVPLTLVSYDKLIGQMRVDFLESV